MDLGSLSSLFKTVAPWLATAFGGPLGGLAVDAVSSVFNLQEKTTDSIKAAITGATPEQLLALKKADQDFALQMKALGFKEVTDLEQIAAGDRASARQMQVANRSNMPAAVSVFLLSSFVGALIALFFIPVPTPNRDMIIYMVGQLSGFTGAAIAFWLGTTRESANKTDIIANSVPVNTDPTTK